MEKRIVLLLLAVGLVSGCTSTAGAPAGLTMSLRADPSPVFSASPTNILIDVDNKDDKTISNVLVKVFDAGLLGGEPCERKFSRLLPYEFQSFKCLFYAPGLREPAQTEVNALASFETTFSAVQLLDVITQSEYQRGLGTNEYIQAPKSYSYRDRNVLVDVEFSEPPPIIMVPGKKYFVYFTITNAGNGFIKKIEEGDFRVQSQGILECSKYGTLEPEGKTFPRLACEIVVPEQFMGDKPFRSTQFVIDFNYNYELRNSMKIDIIK